MGTYDDGYWKIIDDERFYIVVKDHILTRKIMIRDGKWTHTDNTIVSSRVLKINPPSVESQLTELLDKYLSEEDRNERQVDNAVSKMNEVYSDDW